MISSTSGCLDDDLERVDVGVTEDGKTIKVAEQMNPEALDTDTLYNKFPKRADESDADFTLRRFAMKGAIRKAINSGATNQVYSIDAPFRVEPSEMDVNFLATPNGGWLVHIDIMERRKEKQKKLTFVGGKTGKGDHVAPASAPAKYAWNGAK